MKALKRISSGAKAWSLIVSSSLVVACGGSLDKTPEGALSTQQVTTPSNLDGLVTAAYSWLGNDHYTNPNFFWPTGNIRGGDAQDVYDEFRDDVIRLAQVGAPRREAVHIEVRDLVARLNTIAATIERCRVQGGHEPVA